MFPQSRAIKGAGGVLILPIMKIDFSVFSERVELNLPAAFYLIEIYQLSPVKGQHLRVFLLCARLSNAICRKSPFFKLQNLSSPTIVELSSLNFQDMFQASKSRKISKQILFQTFKLKLLKFENLGSQKPSNWHYIWQNIYIKIQNYPHSFLYLIKKRSQSPTFCSKFRKLSEGNIFILNFHSYELLLVIPCNQYYSETPNSGPFYSGPYKVRTNFITDN